jgi:hypothetical protein
MQPGAGTLMIATNRSILRYIQWMRHEYQYLKSAILGHLQVYFSHLVLRRNVDQCLRLPLRTFN